MSQLDTDKRIPSFISYIEKVIIENWDKDALTDYKGATLQYKDVARKIEKIHIIFENGHIRPGDKIAICGRNSSQWSVAFLATLTYGAVAVPILHEFNSEQIHNIVNHSEAKLLFVGDVVATTINTDNMPGLEAVIYLPDTSLVISRSERITYAREHLNELYGKKYPKYFRKEHVKYRVDDPEELALINYTSGTTGFSKGVMIPYRAIWSNLDFCLTYLGDKLKKNSNMLCILPMAHMYGMAVEFIFPFCHGHHIYFLSRLPSPAIIAEAFSEVKPAVVISVPLIIEKIIRKKVFPKIQTNTMRVLLNMPLVNKRIKQKISEEVLKAFGGNIYEVIIGGAAFSQEVEEFLTGIEFPVTVGYGTTECAPLICYSDYHYFAPGSCGRAVSHMEVKILSKDPENISGEIITRGMNVMLGYYKDLEATKAAIDEDGWYHTGDIGIMDADGNVFIKGRMKNMILGSSGQNIYPEEIEDALNSMMMVTESVVVQRNEKLTALVYPDYDEAKQMGLDHKDLVEIMEQNRQKLNDSLPSYSKITAIELREDEFEKTPKKSIKRYLYQ